MRDQLIDLGETLIRQRGFGGFSYADLAGQAGIRKASIHHHFPTKADFGLAVLIQYGERLRTMLDTFSDCRSGGQTLYRAIGLYRETLQDGEHLCLCVALAANRPVLSERMNAVLAQTNAATAGWLEGTLLRGRQDRSISVGGEPSDEALAILAQLQGAQLIARAAKDLALFDQAIAPLLARINRH